LAGECFTPWAGWWTRFGRWAEPRRSSVTFGSVMVSVETRLCRRTDRSRREHFRSVPEALAKTVERLWRAFVEGGVADVVELVDDEVVWIPRTADGRALRGRDALLGWEEENRRRGRRVDAHVYALEQRGDAVLVAARLRVRERDRYIDRQVHWLYRFSDGRLRRAESFDSREAALAALR
jgi:ketosteroid isomerase-like protein